MSGLSRNTGGDASKKSLNDFVTGSFANLRGGSSSTLLLDPQSLNHHLNGGQHQD